MFYVANVITFSVVLELLWKFTLLVSYKLIDSGLHRQTSLMFVHCYLLVTLGSYRYFKWSIDIMENPDF